MSTTFTGTGRLVRLAWRRDRVVVPAWVVSIAALGWAVAASVSGLYADPAERAAGAAFGAQNPMARVFDGPASGTSTGALTVVEAFQVLAVLVALMAAQAVVRHTRQDEETGRAELVGAAVVGRGARLAAALLASWTAVLAAGAVFAVVLVATGLPPGGSLTAGAALAGVGLTFSGIAAVAAQVSSTARGANGLAGAALGVAFLLRAVGDLRGEVLPSGVELRSSWPSWLSPIGWGQQMRPFHTDQWAVAGLFVALTAVLVVVAFRLSARRDVGAGLVPTRLGPARAGRSLSTPLGLAWRLQRGVLLTWVLSLGAAGAAFGSITGEAEEVVTVSDQLADAFARMAGDATVADVYVTIMMAVLGVAAGAYVVQGLLRMRAEESAGRLEPVLATAVGRRRWLAGHVVIVGGGAVVVLLTAGVAAGLARVVTGEAWGEAMAGPVAAAAAHVPAVLALGGFVLVLFGLLPRWAGALPWAALAASLVMGQLGALFELPQAVLNLSPFTHVPAVPVEAFTVTPVLALAATAVALAALGAESFRRRDLATPA